MNSPRKRVNSTKTGVYWFRKAVPKDLQAALGKREFLRSLRTKDPTEARTLHANVAAELEKHWKALRSPAETLTQKQVIALAGVFYLELTAELSDEPGSPTIWEHWLRIERQARDAGKLEQWLDPAVDRLLAQHGLNIDAGSQARLLIAISEASEQAAAQLKRNAEGDYSPDPKASRFPEWKPKEEPKVAADASDGTGKYYRMLGCSGHVDERVGSGAPHYIRFRQCWQAGDRRQMGRCPEALSERLAGKMERDAMP